MADLKKGDRVVWKTREHVFEGDITAVKGKEIYVLFGKSGNYSGGHWLNMKEVELANG